MKNLMGIIWNAAWRISLRLDSDSVASKFVPDLSRMQQTQENKFDKLQEKFHMVLEFVKEKWIFPAASPGVFQCLGCNGRVNIKKIKKSKIKKMDRDNCIAFHPKSRADPWCSNENWRNPK